MSEPALKLVPSPRRSAALKAYATVEALVLTVPACMFAVSVGLVVGGLLAVLVATMGLLVWLLACVAGTAALVGWAPIALYQAIRWR